MITLKLLLWVLVIAAFVMAGTYQIRKGNRPFYLLENIFKGIAFILYGVYVWDTQYETFTLILIIWCASTWWVLFDSAMGVILHGNPFYVGKNSGWIDRFHYINNWTKVAYWICKFIALWAAIGSTRYIYLNA
jgi:hypothetical protein